MYTIRQEEMFSLQELMDMAPESKYSLIFKDLNLTPALRVLDKTSRKGRPQTVNYRAMIYSLLIACIERIPFTKDLIRRLMTSEEFRILCRFDHPSTIGSPATYCRMYTKLAESKVLWELQHQIIQRAQEAGFLSTDVIAFDSTHVESDERMPSPRSREKAKSEEVPGVSSEIEQLDLVEEEPPVLPVVRLEDPRKKYKRGRPNKQEAERRRIEREEWEASLPLFERKTEELLPHSYEELAPLIPTKPDKGCKHYDGEKMFWHGYKLHVLADCQGHYVLTALMSSASVNDGKMAIPLWKKFQQEFPQAQVQHGLGDAGYDILSVYKQVRALGAWPLIDFNERSKDLPAGLDDHFRPICKEGHSYVYDSFDPTYKRLKFTRPKECKTCPFQESGECQSVHKVRVETDLRRFTVPARGSHSYEKLYAKRTTVERVFAYLKEYFGLGHSRHRGPRAEVAMACSVLSYTLCRYAVDCRKRNPQQAAA